MGFGESVLTHVQFLEGGLSGEECKQRCHAIISVLEPVILNRDADLMKGLNRAISERLEELVPVLCTALCRKNR